MGLMGMLFLDQQHMTGFLLYCLILLEIVKIKDDDI